MSFIRLSTGPTKIAFSSRSVASLPSAVSIAKSKASASWSMDRHLEVIDAIFAHDFSLVDEIKDAAPIPVADCPPIIAIDGAHPALTNASACARE